MDQFDHYANLSVKEEDRIALSNLCRDSNARKNGTLRLGSAKIQQR